MTAYVMAGNGTLRDIGNAAIFGVTTARSGGDTIDTNGFSFTIDQDTRYGLSGSATYSMGNMTVNASKGGSINIDARYVRMIPYTSGSGTATLGAQITCGSATGYIIGVYSTIQSAPGTGTGSSGWIKVTGWNGVPFPTSGTFTQGGITFTINGADVVGFIEVVGDDAGTITANRLGTVNIRGAWFDVGTTSGSSATMYTLPTNGSAQYYPAVWVETAAGSDIYEPYPCAGSLVAASSTATDVRGKCHWSNTGGVLRFGSDGTNTVGYVPPAGCKIRIPNILTACCTTAARGANALPNATLATRYDFTTAGGGVVNIDKALLNWYPSISQAYSLSITDTGIATQLSIAEVAQPMTISNVCVGQEAANTQTALIMSMCFAGGTISDSTFTRAGLATAVGVVSISDITGFTFSNCRAESRLVKANVGGFSFGLTRVKNSTFTGTKVIGGKIIVQFCSGVTFANTSFADLIVGTTTTTAAQNNYLWDVSYICDNLVFDGADFFGLTNVQPYLGVLGLNAAGMKDIKLRNVGTRAAPLSLGSTNASAYLISTAASYAGTNIKVQRCFVSNTRTNLHAGFDNSANNVVFENCMGDFADVPVASGLNTLHRGVGGTPTYAAQTAVYGTHWFDHFTSATVGRIAVLMNEPTVATAAQVSLTGGAAFTAAGGLYMPTIGMTATFEMPYFSLGHTGFANSALVMAGGGAVGNFRFYYQIDPGSGFGAWSSQLTAAALGTALNGLGAINPATGFKLRLKIETTTANTTAITSVYVITSSTALAQENFYPLDSAPVVVSGLVAGSRVKFSRVDNGAVLYAAAESDGSVSFADNQYTGAILIEARKASSAPYYIPWVTQVTPVSGQTTTATALQQLDE